MSDLDPGDALLLGFVVGGVTLGALLLATEAVANWLHARRLPRRGP